MPQVLVRDIETDVLEKLKRRAQKNHRSLEAELRVVFEQAVESQRRVKLQRRGSCRRRPRYMGAVKHGIVLVDRRVGGLTPQHQARNLARCPVGLRQHLIDAGTGADLASRCQWSTRQQIPCL